MAILDYRNKIDCKLNKQNLFIFYLHGLYDNMPTIVGQN